MACCKVCCGCAICEEGDSGKCCCGEGSEAACCQEGEYCCDGVCQAEPCGECVTDDDCCPPGYVSHPDGLGCCLPAEGGGYIDCDGVPQYCCDDGCGGSPCCTVCVYYAEDDCGYTRPTWDCSFTQSMCDDYGGTFYRVGGVVTVPAFTAKADHTTCTGDEEEFGPYDVNPCDCTYEESPP